MVIRSSFLLLQKHFVSGGIRFVPYFTIFTIFHNKKELQSSFNLVSSKIFDALYIIHNTIASFLLINCTCCFQDNDLQKH